MMSRMTFWPDQASTICAARPGPMPSTSRSLRRAASSMTSNTRVAERLDELAREHRADAPDQAGPEVALDALEAASAARCAWTWRGTAGRATRSLAHSPTARISSPAAIDATCPTTVSRSRRPRTLTRSTQKPVVGIVERDALDGAADGRRIGAARLGRRGPSAMWPERQTAAAGTITHAALFSHRRAPASAPSRNTRLGADVGRLLERPARPGLEVRARGGHHEAWSRAGCSVGVGSGLGAWCPGPDGR